MGEDSGSLTRDEVHEALAALNDNLRLAEVSLAARLPGVGAVTGVDARAEAVRAELLQAIEVLRPPRRLPFGSPEARSYDVLSLRYAGSLSIDEMCDELSLSRRQIHRDLVRAEEKLTQVLSERLQSRPPDSASRQEQLGLELARARPEFARIRLEGVIADAVSLLQPLATRVGAEVRADPAPDACAIVVADLARLKQLLVQALAAAVALSGGGRVRLSVRPEGETATLLIAFRAPAAGGDTSRLEDIRLMAATGGMAFDFELAAGQDSRIRLGLRRGSPASVLVVEDNPGAVELYRRYLAEPGWEVHHVADPRSAYDVARSVRPDVIVLDVMLPKMDGWTVLGLLSGARETADIPIVVCSVVNEPELARGLGAVAYLTKPVSRAQFVAALEQALARRSPPRPGAAPT